MAAWQRRYVPGFVNAHSHTFQRALADEPAAGTSGRGGSSCSPRPNGRPESVRELYTAAYGEMRRAGYTAVGEFHYLGLEEARAAVDAATEAGVTLVVLLAAYARGGLPRMRQESLPTTSDSSNRCAPRV